MKITTEVDRRLFLQERITRYAVPEPNSGCWLWSGFINENGYGMGYLPGHRGSICAHRISYMAYIGDPTGKMVCHKCDTRPCVNPDHLFLGTNMDNNRDRDAKKRSCHHKNTNPFRGTTWDVKGKKWKASYQGGGRHWYLGLFEDRNEAAKAARIARTAIEKGIKFMHVQSTVELDREVSTIYVECSGEVKKYWGRLEIRNFECEEKLTPDERDQCEDALLEKARHDCGLCIPEEEPEAKRYSQY